MFKSICFILFLLPSLRVTDQAGTWALKTDKNGIQVYTKSVTGSSTDAVKSVCVFNSSLSGMVSLVQDIAAYKKWIFHCATAKNLKTISGSELIYYQETSVPWPASNRDFIGDLKISQNPQTGVITATVENMPDYIPQKSGIVRLKKFSETVIITPKGKNKSELSYEMLMDVGGNIPGWMVNMALTDGPYESLLAMGKLVDTGVYSKARFAFIKEVY
jgi:hypothetical protein